MPRYKVLKSVAHNVADSFVSPLNNTRDGHVICHLLINSRNSGEDSYYIDFLSGNYSGIFDDSNLKRVVPFYLQMFWDNVDTHGSTRSYVATAKLAIKFDLSVRRERRQGFETPYNCEVTLIDDRGINHSRVMAGWWLLETPFRWRRTGSFIKRMLG